MLSRFTLLELYDHQNKLQTTISLFFLFLEAATLIKCKHNLKRESFFLESIENRETQTVRGILFKKKHGLQGLELNALSVGLGQISIFSVLEKKIF